MLLGKVWFRIKVRCVNCGLEQTILLNEKTIYCDFCNKKSQWICIDGKNRCDKHYKEWWFGKGKFKRWIKKLFV